MTKVYVPPLSAALPLAGTSFISAQTNWIMPSLIPFHLIPLTVCMCVCWLGQPRCVVIISGSHVQDAEGTVEQSRNLLIQ